MQRREPLTEDEKVTLDEVMERNQDDPLRKLGAIELGALYWAQYGTHIGGTRRGSLRRDRPDFGRQGSFLVKITRLARAACAKLPRTVYPKSSAATLSASVVACA
jgi:hypothetical protein